ncbi:XdhC family protein [Actibacterium sp. MT2.3-13A]|uniref:XdhC family protein n=1 Tax=Actibacterium sp. MT2.3-13A TaxID=2828332 RepID=UPI001BA44033|nr:XdhC family protein [Actibacterium sp. MT2.3-13A]
MGSGQSFLEHPADVLAALAASQRQGAPCALVVLTGTEGGSARPVGSLATVDGQGRMAGYVSNGCIDADVVQQALAALDDGRPRALRYGKGSPFIDLRLPCGGAIELVIDPRPDPAMIATALEALEARRPVRIRLAGDQGLTAVLPDGGGPCPTPAAQTAELFYRPRPRLALAGRGAVLRAAAHQGALLGMELALASPDRADLDALAPLAPAFSLHLARPGAPAALPCDADTALLLLFHDHEWETALLADALRGEAFYIGALGSPRTHAMRCAALEAAGVPPEALARIHGPVGMVRSLKNASHIALSALAEIVAALQERQAAAAGSSRAA